VAPDQVRIARNDPALAAAVAAAAVSAGEQSLRRLLPRLASCSLTQGAALLRTEFPSGVLQESILRAKGSRAHARFAVLAPLSGRLDLMRLIFDARQRLGAGAWTAHRAGIVVTAHAAARLAQRGTGHAALRALAAEIGLHVLAVAAWRGEHDLEPGEELLSCHGAGVLVWVRKDSDCLAVTFFRPDTAADPAVRRLAAAAHESGNVQLLTRPAGSAA
jgi:hypothetical protein